MKMIKTLKKNRCYKKRMTTSIMIHSGLSRLSNYEMLVLPEYRDAGKKALMITMLLAEAHLDSYVWLVDQNYMPKAWRCGLVLFLLV
jgi:hypothetical protein